MFDECFEYDDHLRANGYSTGGEALEPAERALTLYWRNGKVATTDGPYAETEEQLGGIGVLEARDMNHAVTLMSQHPALKYGTIWEIRPAGDMSSGDGERLPRAKGVILSRSSHSNEILSQLQIFTIQARQQDFMLRVRRCS